MDYYAALGVHPSASGRTIRAAYRRLAKKYHPDVATSAGATQVMQIINAAYAVLGNPRRRIEYDQWRRATLLSTAPHPPSPAGPTSPWASGGQTPPPAGPATGWPQPSAAPVRPRHPLKRAVLFFGRRVLEVVVILGAALLAMGAVLSLLPPRGSSQASLGLIALVQMIPGLLHP